MKKEKEKECVWTPVDILFILLWTGFIILSLWLDEVSPPKEKEEPVHECVYFEKYDKRVQDGALPYKYYYEEALRCVECHKDYK